ncbi:MAG: hypothetical protein HY319_32245 [Armatimonadetes bacterium]|nr:hypothetical protein [Armatimonadota bacterium]
MKSISFSSEVLPELMERLQSAGVTEALANVCSSRMRIYLSRPVKLLRDGWRLAPDCGQAPGEARTYVRGDMNRVGQRLEFHRESLRGRLVTRVYGQVQEITFATDSGEVAANSLVTSNEVLAVDAVLHEGNSLRRVRVHTQEGEELEQEGTFDLVDVLWRAVNGNSQGDSGAAHDLEQPAACS